MAASPRTLEQVIRDCRDEALADVKLALGAARQRAKQDIEPVGFVQKLQHSWLTPQGHASLVNEFGHAFARAYQRETGLAPFGHQIRLVASTDERIWRLTHDPSRGEKEETGRVLVNLQTSGGADWATSQGTHELVATLRVLSDNVLAQQRAVVRELATMTFIGRKTGVDESVARAASALIEAEQQRRINRRDRPHYAQSDVARVIEARPVRGFTFGLGHNVQDLVLSFLSIDAGTAHPGHPSLLPRVAPRA